MDLGFFRQSKLDAPAWITGPPMLLLALVVITLAFHRYAGWRLDRLTELMSRVPEVERTLANARSEVTRFQWLPGDEPDGPERITAASYEAAARHDFQIVSLTMEEGMDVSISGRGAWHPVLNFLSAYQKPDSPLTVKSFVLRAADRSDDPEFALEVNYAYADLSGKEAVP